jgi:hypothetical protein
VSGEPEDRLRAELAASAAKAHREAEGLDARHAAEHASLLATGQALDPLAAFRRCFGKEQDG